MLSDLTPQFVQLAPDGTVVHDGTNPRENATDQRRVYVEARTDLFACQLCEPGFERSGLLLIEGLGR